MTMTLAEYATQLAAAGKALHPLASKTLNRTAKEIRDDWKARAIEANRRHAPGYPHSIRAVWAHEDAGNLVAEVGPSRGKAAKLGTVLEWGGPRSAPQRNYEPALRREIPIMCEHLAKIAAQCLS